MEKIIHGNLREQGLEVVSRSGRTFVRYDAGAHVIAWREDEISESELKSIKAGGDIANEAMFSLQRRLQNGGIDPYVSNWRGPEA
jgi:hypothetical protein